MQNGNAAISAILRHLELEESDRHKVLGCIEVDLRYLEESDILLGKANLTLANYNGYRGSVSVTYQRESIAELLSDQPELIISIEDLDGRYSDQSVADALTEKYGLVGKLQVKSSVSDVRNLTSITLTAHPLCFDYYGAITVTIKEK